MANVLAFAEQRDGELRGTAREAVSAAAEVAVGLGGEAHALVLGGPGITAAASDLARFGAASILVGEHGAFGDYTPEGYAPVVADRISNGGYAAVVFPASTLGKDLAPRVAALLDVPLVSDITGMEVVDGAITVVRPVYAGKAFAHVRVDAAPTVVSIRPNVFQPTEHPASGTVEAFEPAVDEASWKVRVIERKTQSEGSLDVGEATIVVSGGRGMKDPSNWNILEDLRDAIGDGVALGSWLLR